MSNANRPQRWPTKALNAAETAMYNLVEIGRRCGDIERTAQDFDTVAEAAGREAHEVDRLLVRLLEAARNGNHVLVIQLTHRLRDANANARTSEATLRRYAMHVRGQTLDVRRLASEAGEVLAMARRGEYRE